jgi:hypothetical protein
VQTDDHRNAEHIYFLAYVERNLNYLHVKISGCMTDVAWFKENGILIGFVPLMFCRCALFDQPTARLIATGRVLPQQFNSAIARMI